jgi:hypothetical protein
MGIGSENIRPSIVTLDVNNFLKYEAKACVKAEAVAQWQSSCAVCVGCWCHSPAPQTEQNKKLTWPPELYLGAGRQMERRITRRGRENGLFLSRVSDKLEDVKKHWKFGQAADVRACCSL